MSIAFRRTLAAVGTLALLGTRAAAEVKNPDTFVYLDFAEPDTLDPAWPTELVSQGVILSIYETLFTPSQKKPSKLEPLIATKVPTRANGLISADGRTYRIPIRAGVRFHDGTPLTPDDVRYSLLRFMLQDRADGPSSELLLPLTGRSSTRDAQGRLVPEVFGEASRSVSVEGGDVVLRLPAPFAPLLATLAARAPVVSREWAAANGDWDGSEAAWPKHNNPDKQSAPFFMRADGSGPFKLERWDRALKELVLERNDAYWGRKAQLKRVVLRVVPEFGTRKLALQAGDADSIAADPATLSQLQGLDGVRLVEGLGRASVEPVAYFTFALNPTANPDIGSGRLDGDGIPPDFFADKDARKAFAFAFDYAGFIRDVYRGKAVQATGLVPRGVLGHNPDQPVYSYDPALAREHFQKAWGGKIWEKGFRFTLTYNSGNASRQTICEMLKRSVESLNDKFRIDVRALDWPAYLDAARAAKLPVSFFNLSSDFPDPHGFAFDAMDSRGGDAMAQGYRSEEADRLVERAMRAGDTAERRRLYFRLQAVEHEDVPHLLFVEAPVTRVYRSWLKGIVHNPHAFYPRLDALYKEE
jgi:peptide/nickel transport system substrate-binding protein